MKPIILWQYRQLEGELGQLETHLLDSSCPCKSEGENCPRKHLVKVSFLARETYAILARDNGSELELEELTNLTEQADDYITAEEALACGADIETMKPEWASRWRKVFEAKIIGACHMRAEQPQICDLAAKPKKPQEPRWCIGVKAVDKEIGRLGKTLGSVRNRLKELQRNLNTALNICAGQAEMFQAAPIAVLDPYGSRCRDPNTGHWITSEVCGFVPAGTTTTALGMGGLGHYEFEFKILSLDDLVMSHDPYTFSPNPSYPGELQPRLRERTATKMQVEKIAANIEPDALITDFHVLDRGAPIVGPDLAVESGNGRTMALVRAVEDYPDSYEGYRSRLRERASDFGFRARDVDDVKNPILVRLRITEVDRTAFTQESNQAATISTSAIENARIDAQKITVDMLAELNVSEIESLEDALRAPKNQAFARRFLQTLPENIRASLVDAHGYLNRDGVHRMAMAIFVSAFQGDAGLRLAEKAFESVDMDVRNTVSAIARSLGVMAQAESLVRSGERQSDLSIADDLAQAVNVYAAIRRTPELTVEKYLAQGQLLERELTDFQEHILVTLNDYRRSPKKLASIFTAYAEGVLASPPPSQQSLFPGVEIRKEELWESAVNIGSRAEEAPRLMQSQICNQEVKMKVCTMEPAIIRAKQEGEMAVCEMGQADPILSEIASQICTIGMCNPEKPSARCGDATQRLYNWARGALVTDELASKTQATWAPRLTAKNRREALRLIDCTKKLHPEWEQEYEEEIRRFMGATLSQKPVCTPKEAKKLERCIVKVKKTQPKSCKREWSKAPEDMREGCYNPWAACSESVGCRR